jgi:hypothetical protein
MTNNSKKLNDSKPEMGQVHIIILICIKSSAGTIMYFSSLENVHSVGQPWYAVLKKVKRKGMDTFYP